MLFATAVLALVALGGAHSPSLTSTRFALTPNPEHEVAVLPTAPYVVQLSAQPRSSYKKALLKAALQNQATKDVTSLSGTSGDAEYVAPITIGGQNFQVIVDTGSSDTWLVHNGFHCINTTDNKPAPEDTCSFGPTYSTRRSKTFVGVGDKNFNITYADLEYVVGDVAKETVALAGLTVTKQIIGVVNEAAWNGDGINSGLVGLAYPFITSVFNGTDPAKDSGKNFFEYNPFFFSAIAENAVKQPLISIALDRGTFAAEQNSTDDKNKGTLGFGGIVPVKTTKTQTTVPVQGYKLQGLDKPTYIWYTVDAAYVFGGAPAHDNTTAILDTGTTLNYLPTNVTAAYNAKFSPPGAIDPEFGFWAVDCNAKAPPFSVAINGVSFPVSAADQILPSGLTDKNGKAICISGTQDGGDPANPNNTFILGDVFLHNVVATFNLVANTINLAAREPY